MEPNLIWSCNNRKLHIILDDFYAPVSQLMLQNLIFTSHGDVCGFRDTLLFISEFINVMI